MCVRVHNLLGTSSRDRWGEDLFREGDDAHDRRNDDVHRVVLDRVRVDASVLELKHGRGDPERDPGDFELHAAWAKSKALQGSPKEA